MEPSTIAGTVTGGAGFKRTPSASLLAYAASARKVSQATLEQLGVGSGTVFFPELRRENEAVFFPYRVAGEVVNWKAASFPEKAFTSKKGGKLAFWNLDTVLAAGPDTVYLTEGEWDAVSLVEAGIPASQVLSVPNGARDRAAAKDDEKPTGYGYVEEALEAGLCKAKRFVWCGDMDGPGRSLRADMVRILGAARFWYVEWPDPAKDANDALRFIGHAAVYDLVRNGQLPWPVDGLFRMSEIPEPPPLVRWHPGFMEWGDKLYLAPRTLSVATGHPGHGKTTFWLQVWAQIVRHEGIVAGIASFETETKPHHRRNLRQVFSGRLERDMSHEETRRADAWIEDRFLWMRHPEDKPGLDWFLDRAEIAVVRHAARIIQVDPWNRLESQRDRDETQHEYIGRCLRTLHSFAKDMNVHVQIIAHPKKSDPANKKRPPDLEDISDSKHWDNMVDQGFSIHRPQMFDDDGRRYDAHLYYLKSRYAEALGFPCRLNIELDPITGRYRSGERLSIPANLAAVNGAHFHADDQTIQ